MRPRRANALARLGVLGEAGRFDELLDKANYRPPAPDWAGIQPTP